MKNEVWKDIIGYEKLYQVSNFGNVKTLRKNKLLKPTINYRGYLCITLSKNGKSTQYKIHRLVATAFLHNYLELPQVNHKDGDKLNNCVDNLEWCSPNYNMRHSYQNNLTKGAKKIIEQYDKNGNLIKRWNSMTEASKVLDIAQPSISRCCCGKSKTAGEYIWRKGGVK